MRKIESWQGGEQWLGIQLAVGVEMALLTGRSYWQFDKSSAPAPPAQPEDSLGGGLPDVVSPSLARGDQLGELRPMACTPFTLHLPVA